MKTREMLGVGKIDGAFGVEIEVETNHEPPPGIRGMWNKTEDGSLRGNSAEYVFSKPLSLEDSHSAVVALKERLDENKVKVNESFRAGVHIHMNMLEKNEDEILRFLLAYYLIEDVIISWCGPNRVGNLFCLGIRDAEATIDRLCEILQSCPVGHRDELLGRLMRMGDNFRYSAMNIGALGRHGTVEFRALETRPDFQNIHEALDFFALLQEKVTKWATAKELLQDMVDKGPVKIATNLLANTPLRSRMYAPNFYESVRHNYALVLTCYPYVTRYYGSSSKKKKKKQPTLRTNIGNQVWLDEMVAPNPRPVRVRPNWAEWGGPDAELEDDE